MVEGYKYLLDDFDPNTLRVADLKNVLTLHGVQFAMASRKKDLVATFNEHIVPQRAKLRRQFIDPEPSMSRIEDASDAAASPVNSPTRSPRRTRRTVSAKSDELPQADELKLPASPRRGRKPSPKPLDNVLLPAPDLKPRAADVPKEKAPRSPRSPRRKLKSEIDSSDPEPEPLSRETLSRGANGSDHISKVEAADNAEPKSPRRRRVTRQVRLPNETEAEKSISVDNMADIDVVSRSPRRKAKEEELGGTFSQDNVFQIHSTTDRKKRKNEDIETQAATQSEAHLNKVQALRPASAEQTKPSISESRPRSAPSLPRVPPARTLPRFQIQPRPEASDSIQLEIDTPFGPEVVQQYIDPSPELNFDPEPAPLQIHTVPELAARPVSAPALNTDPKPAFPHRAAPPTKKEKAQPRRTAKSHEVPVTDATPQFSSTKERSTKKSIENVPTTPTVLSQTPAKSRRTLGSFLPSLSVLQASHDFAHQLDPQFSPSPAPTPIPQPQTKRESEVIPQAASPSARKSGTDGVSDEGGDADSEPESAEPRPESDLEESVTDHEGPTDDLHVGTVYGKLGSTASFLARGTIFALKFALIFSSIAALLYSGKWYRDELAAAEFCDVGIASNPPSYPSWTAVIPNLPEYAPDGLDALISEAQHAFRDAMDSARPQCVKCPEHGKCFPGRVLVCEEGYRQEPSILGMGGLWPLPPSCVADVERLRLIQVLAERAANVLRERRASAVCKMPDTTEAAINSASEMAEGDLYQVLLTYTHESLSNEEVASVWDQVVRGLQEHADIEVVRHVYDTGLELELEAHGNVEQTGLTKQQLEEGDRSVVSDGHGAPSAGSASSSGISQEKESAGPNRQGQKVFVSSSLALASLECKARLYVYSFIKAHRDIFIKISLVLLALCGAIATIVVLIKRRQRRKAYVAKLVAALQRQQMIADNDRTGVTERYLTTGSLRGGIPSRLWPAIQREVELTPGVRVRVLEIHGEITRVWEWV